MSQELNQYGSIAVFADDEPQQYNIFAEEEPVAVAVAPKSKTIKPPRKQPTKKAVKEVAVVAEVVVAEPVKEVAKPVIADDCEVVDMSVIERMIADAVAPLQQRIKAIEDHEDAQPLRAEGGRLGYYQVKDGDEELNRLRNLNRDLRKEIEAKTKTNQQLQDQLLGDEGNEVVRLREMNAALRKERDGARKGRKEAMEMAEKYRRLLEANGICYEAD